MDKRRGVAVGIITGMIFLSMIVFFLREEPSTPEEIMAWDEEMIEEGSMDKIAQIFIEGVIAEDSNWDQTFGYYALMDQLQQVEKDDAVKGIVLRVDTPGGSVVASDEIYEQILAIKEKGKKVIVSMGSTAASGGYYISAPADKIFAHRATITGSLGVIFSFYNFSGLADKYGVDEVVIKSGTYKDIGNPLRPMSDGEAAIFQQLVDESYDRFVEIISKGRNMPRERVIELADGRIYSGLQAKELGLIDEIGDLESATHTAKELAGTPDASVIRYIEPFSMDDWINDFISLQSRDTDILGVKQVLSPDRPPQLQYLFKP